MHNILYFSISTIRIRVCLLSGTSFYAGADHGAVPANIGSRQLRCNSNYSNRQCCYHWRYHLIAYNINAQSPYTSKLQTVILLSCSIFVKIYRMKCISYFRSLLIKENSVMDNVGEEFTACKPVDLCKKIH